MNSKLVPNNSNNSNSEANVSELLDNLEENVCDMLSIVLSCRRLLSKRYLDICLLFYFSESEEIPSSMFCTNNIKTAARHMILLCTVVYVFFMLKFYIYRESLEKSTFKNVLNRPVRVFPIRSNSDHCSSSNETCLLTLFTTFSNRPDREHIELNTINNWAALGSKVLCVNMITSNNDSFITRETDARYWGKLKVTKTELDELPVVKYMFMDLIEENLSKYYAYANSDMLFGQDLMTTLATIDIYHQLNHNDSGFLIVGGRWNVDTSLIGTDVTNHTHLMHLKSIGELQPGHTTDYFITPGKGYPWRDIEEVVVARTAWDNYIVATANDKHIISYDATRSVTAIHQSYKGIGNSGANSTNPEFNKKLLTKNYQHDLINHLHKYGQLHQTSHFTYVDEEGMVQIGKRDTSHFH